MKSPTSRPAIAAGDPGSMVVTFTRFSLGLKKPEIVASVPKPSLDFPADTVNHTASRIRTASVRAL
jgi:hypothetical protein